MTSSRTRMCLLVEQLEELAAQLHRPVRLMEVCGTHTVNACRSGIHSLMPSTIRLVSGPGCPVCVTPGRYVDALIELAGRPRMTLATYGDMVRVTGARGSLETARSAGADVRVVTSSMEAVEIARAEPRREVVFAAVGFETTAPATATAILTARKTELMNFSVLSGHKLVVPAMSALLEDPDVPLDGFLCPGHVSVVIGADAYTPIVQQYNKPCAISGFEPLQIMQGIVHLTKQVLEGQATLENLYPQAVRRLGNPVANRLIEEVFQVCDSTWRMLGVVPQSGLEVKPEFARFDAQRCFTLEWGPDREPAGCRCGEVITGKCEPYDCPLFATVCTPIDPIGPCMVSSEGTCQAWFKYRRREAQQRKLQEVAS